MTSTTSAAAVALAHPPLTRQHLDDLFHLAILTEDRTTEEQDALDTLASALDATA